MLLRKETPLLRLPAYVHETLELDGYTIRIDWFNQKGDRKQAPEWADSRAFTKMITRSDADGEESAVAILVNAHGHSAHMRLSEIGKKHKWHVAFRSSSAKVEFEDESTLLVPERTIALLLTGRPLDWTGRFVRYIKGRLTSG